MLRFQKWLPSVSRSMVLTTLVWTTVVLLAMLIGWDHQWFGMHGLELRSVNARFHTRGPTLPDRRLVFIAIDDSSILGDSVDDDEVQENPGYELLKNYPYPRKTYALIIEKLVNAGARVVVFDTVFRDENPLGATPQGRADDAAFKQALLKYHDKVVIGANFTTTYITSVEAPASPLTMPNPDLLPSEVVKVEDIVGFVNYRADKDNCIRLMNPVGWPYSSKEQLPYSIDALAVKKAYPQVQLPALLEPRYISFAGPRNTYPPIPLHLLFNTKAWSGNRPPLYDGKIFEGKIVLVGPRANIFHDEHFAPFGDGHPDSMPGPDIHLNAMATLLSGRTLSYASQAQSFWCIALLGIVYSFTLPLLKSPLGKLVPAVGFTVGYWAIAQYSFEWWYVFIPMVPAFIIIGGSTACVIIGQAIGEQIEKKRVSGMLQRYVSKNIADELIKSGKSVDSLMAPHERTVTVLFSDVRDFTAMSEASEASLFVHQLNEYLTAMVKCVFNHHGTLDKFVGDSVMAVFGNLTSRGLAEDAWCGVKTAIEMRESLKELNAQWEKVGRKPYRIGIGLNHGEVMAGDIGSSQKAEFGVIGDTVNLAARVESLTKEQQFDILISDSVYQLVKDRVEVEYRGEIKVKGRIKPVGIYALQGLKAG